MRRVEAGSPYCTHTRTRVTEATGAPASTRLSLRGRVANQAPRCLIPFDRREGMTTAEAASVAGRTERCIRLWCVEHEIGRRVAGGPWLVSRVALAMFLDGNATALRAYLAGDRRSDLVRDYYAATGLEPLISRWAVAAV